MESNEQTELTKQETDFIEIRLTARGRGGEGGVKGLSKIEKREKILDTNNSVESAVGRQVGGSGRGCRGDKW